MVITKTFVKEILKRLSFFGTLYHCSGSEEKYILSPIMLFFLTWAVKNTLNPKMSLSLLSPQRTLPKSINPLSHK